MMEKAYDKYRSYEIQGDCYKYVHKCPNCGKVLFEIEDYRFKKYPEEVKIPKY
jgi:hypothetical protein